jgi:GT2 family glycosyltransferase
MENGVDICFVVLHYQTDEDTRLCVESILQYVDTQQFTVVIVDNASDNGSFERLGEVFGRESRVVLLTNPTNLGFARGINVGIRYAKQEWNPTFIAVLNNDTLLLPGSFFMSIARKYEVTSYATLGPMILSGDGRYHANPMKPTVRGETDARRYIRYCKNLLILNRFGLAGLYISLSRLWNRSPKKKDFSACLTDQIDAQLHGCALVFSPAFFAEFDGLDEATFLYMEEDILRLHLQKAGLHSLYTPEIQIFHKEDSATNARHHSSRAKRKMMCTYSIQSLEHYINLLKQ